MDICPQEQHNVAQTDAAIKAAYTVRPSTSTSGFVL